MRGIESTFRILRGRWTLNTLAGLALAGALIGAGPAFADPTFAAGVTTGTTASPLLELSGAAASETNPGVLWVHNDSGDAARIFAISDTGQRLGNYLLTGADNDDYEDIAIGPGPVAGISYIFVGDIGDNSENRTNITVYRIPEPAVYTRRAGAPIVVNIASGTWQALTLVYPGLPFLSANNAETLMVDPRNGDLLVGTKEDNQCRVFRALASSLTGTGTITMALAATVPFDVASAGCISPTGNEVILRRETFAQLWTRGPLQSLEGALSGTPVTLPVAVEANGEAVTFDRIGNGYFTLTEGNPAPVHFYARTSADGPLPRVDLVPAESSWRYLDDGSDQGTAWRAPAFDDSAWATGPAQLGYGENDEQTVTSFGPDADHKHLTTYFRRSFVVDAGVAFDALRLQVLHESGIALFLNGNELLRQGLAVDAASSTVASASRGVLKQAWHVTSIDPAMLLDGVNTLAAEVHLASEVQADLSFDLQLIGAAAQHALTLTENAPDWGEVLVSPAANTPGGARFLHGTELTLNPVPEPGRVLDHWLVFDPAFPEDPGLATTRTDIPLVLPLFADQHVEAVWASAPAEGEGTSEGEAIPCHVQACMLDCIIGPQVTHFESSLANVYQSFGIVGFDPDTTDLDGNGIVDRAHARLVDSVLASGGGVNSCCLMGVYLNNATAAIALADAVFGEEPSVGMLQRDDFESILAGVTTQGEPACVDAVVNLVENFGGLAALDLSGFVLTDDVWIASYGDQDIDGVCNKGEYTASVSGPEDFDTFVAAALDSLTVSNGGGCPACGEGEGDGVFEGAPEGTGEGFIEGILEGTTEGPVEGLVEGLPEGTFDGVVEGAAEGVVEGVGDGASEGEGRPEGEGLSGGEGFPEGAIDGQHEGRVEGEGATEGLTEGTGEGGPDEGVNEGEGTAAEGEGLAHEGEGSVDGDGQQDFQTADLNSDAAINLTELLRLIQFYNAEALHCEAGTEDGFATGIGDQICAPHDSDYNVQDWRISLSELLRLIQFFNAGSYAACPQGNSEDGFCIDLP